MNDNLNNSSPPSSPPGKGMSIASMVLGIVGLVFFWVIYISLPVAIVGIILGALSKKKLVEAGAPAGMATAGIVMSVIVIAASIIFLLACAACVAAAGGLGAFM